MNQDLRAESAIRQLVARYADAVNTRNKDTWASTWAEAATWALPGMEQQGRANIVSMWQGAMAGFPFVFHMMHSAPSISVDGDSATARWYLSEFIQDAQQNNSMNLGAYDDQMSCIDGQWLFTRREFNILYTGPADLSGTLIPYPHFNAQV